MQFFYLLFDLKTLPVTRTIYRRMTAWLMNCELETKLKDAVTAISKVLSRRLHEGTDEIQENLSQDRASPDRDLKTRDPEYEPRMLATRLRRTV